MTEDRTDDDRLVFRPLPADYEGIIAGMVALIGLASLLIVAPHELFVSLVLIVIVMQNLWSDRR